MKRSVLGIILFVAVFGLLLGQSVFYVNENERALVLELGKVVGEERGPGINFKIPFVHRTVFLEKRILSFLIPKTLGLSSDMKPFEIDNYVCWRIVQPQKFVETLRAQAVAEERLRSIVYSQLRAAIGGETLKDVVDTNRKAIMESVLRESNHRVAEYGVEIVDVRIRRSDLPNRQAIFERMNADRKKMANQYRAEGESSSRDIRSLAEKNRDVIIAEAYKQSTIIHGEADAIALQTLNAAIAASPEFYDFLKSLDMYGKAFRENTRIIFSSEDPLLRFMQ